MIGASVYLSYLVMSFSKKLLQLLSVLIKADISSGVNPSAYTVFSDNNYFNLSLAYINTEEKSAQTQCLCHAIVLACYY